MQMNNNVLHFFLPLISAFFIYSRMIPKLLQLATYQTVRNSKFSQQDLEVLPPNLKDRLRFLLLQTDPKNLERLPALLHEKVAELDGDEPKLETQDKSAAKIPSVIQQDPRNRDFYFFRCDLSDPDVEYI